MLPCGAAGVRLRLGALTSWLMLSRSSKRRILDSVIILAFSTAVCAEDRVAPSQEVKLRGGRVCGCVPLVSSLRPLQPTALPTKVMTLSFALPLRTPERSMISWITLPFLPMMPPIRWLLWKTGALARMGARGVGDGAEKEALQHCGRH